MALSTISFSAQLKFGLLTLASVGAVAGLGYSDVGHSILSKIGISQAFARTGSAVSQSAQNGGSAVQAFLARSPGERGAIDILKGKVAPRLTDSSSNSKRPQPSQRALGKVFDEPLQRLENPAGAAPAVAFVPLNQDSTIASLPAAVLPLPGGSGAFSPVIGGIPLGGGFAGGGSGGGGSPIGAVPTPDGGNVAVPPVPPAVAAVPEPSTWILLLLGFAAIGRALRGKRQTTWSSAKRAGNCTTA